MVLIQKSGAGVVIITIMIIAFAATFADDYLQGCRAVTGELENLKDKVQQQNAQAKKLWPTLWYIVTKNRVRSMLRQDNKRKLIMLRNLRLLVLLMSWPIVLNGCASSPQEGHVVVASQVTIPPAPQIVQKTLPRSVDYYQNQF